MKINTLIVFFAFVIIPSKSEAQWRNCALALARNVFPPPAWLNDVSLSDEVASHWVTKPEELPPLVEMIAEAFSKDPLLSWIAPNPQLQRKMAIAEVRRAYLAGGILSVAPAGRAAALWGKLGSVEGPISRGVRSLLSGERNLPKLLGARRDEVENFFEAMEKNRNRIVTETKAKNFLYLAMVGVHEGERGNGIASKVLILPVLNFADSTEQHVLLETHEPKTIRMYERMGFSVKFRGNLGPGVPETIIMLRPPQ